MSAAAPGSDRETEDAALSLLTVTASSQLQKALEAAEAAAHAEPDPCDKYTHSREPSSLLDSLAEALTMSLHLVKLICQFCLPPVAVEGTEPSLLFTIQPRPKFDQERYGVGFSPDKNIWVCAGSHILVYNANGKFLFDCKWSSRCTSVAFNENGEAFAATAEQNDGVAAKRRLCVPTH